MDTVSIIIPVYNTEKYIDQCIESIINQTYKKLDIIIINDWSTDWSGKLCDERAKKDTRIRVIHKKNWGLSDARNTWLGVIKWKYISFIDSDDIVIPAFIEKLYYTIKETKSSFVSCWFFTFNDNNINFPILTWSTAVKTYSKDEYLNLQDSETSCAKLYNSVIFKKLRFKLGAYWEDSWLHPYIIDQSDKISIIYKKYYGYRQRSGSITHTLTKEKVENRLACFEERESFYKKINNQKQAYIAKIKQEMTKNELYIFFWYGWFIDANKRLLRIIFCKDVTLLTKLYQIKQLYFPFISFQNQKIEIYK